MSSETYQGLQRYPRVSSLLRIQQMQFYFQPVRESSANSGVLLIVIKKHKYLSNKWQSRDNYLKAVATILQ